MHQPLRQEWAETPPDVSYRFVVSAGTLRAANAVASAVRKKNGRGRAHAPAFFGSLVQQFIVGVLRFIIGGLLLGLIGWLSLQPSFLVDRLLDPTVRLGTGALLPIITLLATFSALIVGFRIGLRR